MEIVGLISYIFVTVSYLLICSLFLFISRFSSLCGFCRAFTWSILSPLRISIILLSKNLVVSLVFEIYILMYPKSTIKYYTSCVVLVLYNRVLPILAFYPLSIWCHSLYLPLCYNNSIHYYYSFKQLSLDQITITKKIYFYLHLFLFWYSSFLHVQPTFWHTSFYFCLKNLIFLSGEVCCNEFLGFCLSEKVIISHSKQRFNFTG